MEDIVDKKNINDNNNFVKKENNLNNKSYGSTNEKYTNKKESVIKKDKKKKKKKKKNRCPTCNIKLTLVEQTIICACEKSYCTKHRLPHKHNCIYNYKNDKKEFLKKSNPDMNFKKIDEI